MRNSHLLALSALVSSLLVLVAASVAPVDAAGQQGIEEDQVALGQEVYLRACSVCHGENGLGLEEARESFPEDHRDCTRCHRPGNPPLMSLAEVETRQHDLFDVGIAPPVTGPGSMVAAADRDALLAYVSATMPRYRPGSLAPEEYAAVTDFLLSLNGR